MALAAPVLADCISGKTSHVQLLDGTESSDDVAGGIDFLDRHFVPSGHCLLTSPTSPVFVEASYDDACVPVVASVAPGSVTCFAGSTCRGGQMPHITLPLSPCQQSPESSSSATGGVGGATQAGKRKGAIHRCNCGNVQTCQLRKAQANFRKSLRRGFLSPLAAQGNGEEHAEDTWQTGDAELQASQAQAERDKADMLAKQLQACREEAAWLRSRVERLILELKGSIGTAGKLKLQLVDTAANTGAGQPIAHASVDLDMRQWKDSQT
ncbi:TPA: hypothetical protein ACH3X3_005097 [Trebouxia sp. C0006]